MEVLACPCGCVNELHEPTGALRCASKCQYHQDFLRDELPTGLEYYKRLGVVGEDGIVDCARYVEELTLGLPRMPREAWPDRRGVAWELGCGLSPYAPWLLGLGYMYCGADRDLWACAATSKAYCVSTACFDLDLGLAPVSFALSDKSCLRPRVILSAHCLEHLADAPARLADWVELLLPDGEVVIVVPDDTDLTNPDHKWFFTSASLRKAMELAGLVDVAVNMRRVVPHENFLYAIGRRP